jgi:hypothetical protein
LVVQQASNVDSAEQNSLRGMMVGIGMFDETVFLLSSARDDERLSKIKKFKLPPKPAWRYWNPHD